MIRLSGSAAAVGVAAQLLGGDAIEAAAAEPFWQGLREQTDAFFDAAREAIEHQDAALWRLSMPPAAPPLGLAGDELIEWHGAQRWLATRCRRAGTGDGSCGRRPRDDLSRPRQVGRRLQPARTAARRHPRAAQARLRPQGHPQSGPALPGPLTTIGRPCRPPSRPSSPRPPKASEAEAILRKCVHCGFCTATCPTYQLLGDELDGPRGRIYLIKQMLEGEPVTRTTQLHLDRCLTCRNCETTCPSGVQYGNLVEIGRRLVAERVPRPPAERALRAVLREGLTSPLFAPAMKIGQALRPLLPAALRNKVAGAGAGTGATAGRRGATSARCCCCSAASSRR